MKCGCRIIQLPHVEGQRRDEEREIKYCDLHSGGIGSSEAFELLRNVPKDVDTFAAWEAKRIKLLGGG